VLLQEFLTKALDEFSVVFEELLDKVFCTVVSFLARGYSRDQTAQA